MIDVKNKEYQWIFWDFDGTIAESSRGMIETMQDAIEILHLPKKEAKEIRSLIGPPLPSMIEKLFPYEEKAVKEKLFKTHRKIYGEIGWKKVSLYAGIKSLLKESHYLGKKQMIVTLKPEFYVKKICEENRILGFFENVIGVDLTSNPITDKKILLSMAMKELGANSKKSIMIGDTSSDIKAAIDCELDSVGVLFGYGDLSQILEMPTYYAKNAKDLRRILLNDEMEII